MTTIEKLRQLYNKLRDEPQRISLGQMMSDVDEIIKSMEEEFHFQGLSENGEPE